MKTETRTVFVAATRYRKPKAFLTRGSALRAEAGAAVWHALVQRKRDDSDDGSSEFTAALVQKMREAFRRAMRLRFYLDARARGADVRTAVERARPRTDAAHVRPLWMVAEERTGAEF